MNLVTFALDVQGEWASFALDVALQVVVVGQLELGVELDLDWAVTVGWDQTTHWRNLQ
jgi:hypothetical protein